MRTSAPSTKRADHVGTWISSRLGTGQPRMASTGHMHCRQVPRPPLGPTRDPQPSRPSRRERQELSLITCSVASNRPRDTGTTWRLLATHLSTEATCSVLVVLQKTSCPSAKETRSARDSVKARPRKSRSGSKMKTRTSPAKTQFRRSKACFPTNREPQDVVLLILILLSASTKRSSFEREHRVRHRPFQRWSLQGTTPPIKAPDLLLPISTGPPREPRATSDPKIT